MPVAMPAATWNFGRETVGLAERALPQQGSDLPFPGGDELASLSTVLAELLEPLETEPVCSECPEAEPFFFLPLIT